MSRLISALRQQIKFNKLHLQIKNNNTQIKNRASSKQLKDNRISLVHNNKGMITIKTKVIIKNNTKIIPIIDPTKTNIKIEAQIIIVAEIRAKVLTITKGIQDNLEGVETTTISIKIEANILKDNSCLDNSISQMLQN